MNTNKIISTQLYIIKNYCKILYSYIKLKNSNLKNKIYNLKNFVKNKQQIFVGNIEFTNIFNFDYIDNINIEDILIIILS